MPRKEKPLPKPPSAGRKAGRLPREEEAATLMADRIAKAISEGRFEEFMKTEIPDNEYAGKLVSMMMGMTGMLPHEMPKSETLREEKIGPSEVPEDLREAADAGNMEKIVEILKREHEKRSGGSGSASEQEKQPPVSEQTAFEKTILDELLKIASANSVTLDWIIARALKLYVREYRETGRL
jgi:hypothetical protein